MIHIIFMYPETVGRTLEEVEEIFQQGHVFSAWKIGKDVGKKTVQDVLANAEGQSNEKNHGTSSLSSAEK